MATRTTPRKRSNSGARQQGSAAVATTEDDDADNGGGAGATSPLLIERTGGPGAVAAAAPSSSSPPPRLSAPSYVSSSPPQNSRTQLALALVALIAIAHTLAGRGGGIVDPPNTAAAAALATAEQRPRFACASSQAERDAARLDFARNLTRARPWLLRRVSAASRDAQDLFSAGLLEAYGFNAAEAEAFAAQALALSPRCAMCAWLSAYARGPTPNVVADARGSRGAGFPVFGPEDAAQADALAAEALELAQAPSPPLPAPSEPEVKARGGERRLIRALADRNRGAAALVAGATGGEPLPEPWRPRQEAYARELAALAAEVEAGARADGGGNGDVGGDGNSGDSNSGDGDGGHGLAADVLALAAEAHLCLSPWDYYFYDGADAAKPAPPKSYAPPRRLLLKGLWRRLGSNTATATATTTSAAVFRRGRTLRLRPTAAEAERLLRAALRVDPRHPLGLHLMVHVAEAGRPGPKPSSSSSSSATDGDDKADAATAAWRGEAAADALAAQAFPQGHLLHMPSHVYVRVGRYRDALASNAAARRHDLAAASRGRCAPGYVPEHNAQLATYAAATAGMERAALASALGARRLRARVPDLYVSRGAEWTTVPLLRARFGDWRAVLLAEAPRSAAIASEASGGREGAALEASSNDADAEDDDEDGDAEFARRPLMPPPADARGRTLSGGRGFAQVVYHYVRLLALAARADAAAEARASGDKGDLSVAALQRAVARELRALRRAAGDADALHEPRTLPGGAPGLYASGNARLAPIYERIGTARSELAQAARWRGERARRWRRRQQQQQQGKQQQQPSRAEAAAERRALAALGEAAELERALPYSEPPILEAPASACLAWALLQAGRAQEAAEAYARELSERHAENPWALAGLLEALERQEEEQRRRGTAPPSRGSDASAELEDVRRRTERAWRHADRDVRARFGPVTGSKGGGGWAGGGGGGGGVGGDEGGGGDGRGSSSCPQLSAAW